MDKSQSLPLGARPVELALVFLFAFVAVWLVADWAFGPDETPVAEGAPADQTSQLATFAPPAFDTIPEGPDGDAIRRGQQLFRETQITAAEFAGSGLECSNCHIDDGRLADASPMWAAWGMYPAYRSKNDRINTMEDRIMGCFVYSMNAGISPSGGPPPAGHPIYKDFEAYFKWLASGVPTGTEMPGRGYPDVPLPAGGYDRERGAQVYAEHCVTCHGENGEGVEAPDGTYFYPPLWGPRSFNWGAGMSRLSNASGFIKANMPFEMDITLTDEQAWDVAAYVVGHERPADPRQQDRSIEETRAAHHANGDDFYGQVIDGDLLGDGVE